MSTTRPAAFALFVLTLALSPMALADDFDLGWHTVDGGGGSSSGGGFQLSGTIGQPDAGPGASGLGGGEFLLIGGFWPGVPGISLAGDCNGSGAVDLADATDFYSCLVGPGGGLNIGCDCFDFDEDSDTDLADFAAFQVHFTN